MLCNEGGTSHFVDISFVYFVVILLFLGGVDYIACCLHYELQLDWYNRIIG